MFTGNELFRCAHVENFNFTIDTRRFCFVLINRVQLQSEVPLDLNKFKLTRCPSYVNSKFSDVFFIFSSFCHSNYTAYVGTF